MKNPVQELNFVSKLQPENNKSLETTYFKNLFQKKSSSFHPWVFQDICGEAWQLPMKKVTASSAA